MKLYKKILNLFIVLLLLLFIVSCQDDIDQGNNSNTNNNVNNNQIEKVVEKLSIFTLNDFHGALDEDQNGKYGAARLAYLLDNEIKNAEAAVLVSAGDMFQGTALASYNHGKTVIDIMNAMNFDAMTLGNHEFDWGYNEIYQYVDGNQTNGEANFPYLGCNITEKSTNKLVKGVKPYEVIERGGLTIGIIGYIGDTCESSISPQFVEPYEFTSVVPAVKKYAIELRTEHNVDVVIAVGHQDDRYNESLANFSGDAKIDAIVNAHSHQTYSGVIQRNDGSSLPYIQAGSAGQKYGVITLGINSQTKEVKSGISEVRNVSGSNYNLEVKQIITDLKNETAPVFNRIIGVASEYVNKTNCEIWAATALMDYAATDIAVINAGGIRNQGLPIYKGSNITVSTVHGFMPFDNIVKTVTLSGKDVKKIINYFVSSTNVSIDSQTGDIYINRELLDFNKKYTVASIDYIFDNEKYPFLNGENILNTGILFRDVLIETIEQDGSIIIPNFY